MEGNWAVSVRITIRHSFDPANSPLGIDSTVTLAHVNSHVCTQEQLLLHCWFSENIGNHLNIHQWGTSYIHYGTSIQWWC